MLLPEKIRDISGTIRKELRIEIKMTYRW